MKKNLIKVLWKDFKNSAIWPLLIMFGLAIIPIILCIPLMSFLENLQMTDDNIIAIVFIFTLFGEVATFYIYSVYSHYKEAIEYAKEYDVGFEEAWDATRDGDGDLDY